MEYFERFLKIILSVLKLFGIILSTIGLGLMMLIQMICIFFTFIITMCVLVPLEFLVVRPIYFILTGSKFLNVYYGVCIMFEDLIETGVLTFRRLDGESNYDHERWRSAYNDVDFYGNIWDKICNIKIRIEDE